MEHDKWHTLGIILRSTWRQKTLQALNKGIKTPKQLTKETGIKFSHISTVLKELKDLGLIKCLNPKLKTGRLYQITQKGKEILKEL